MTRCKSPDPVAAFPNTCRRCHRPCVAMDGYGGFWRHGARCLSWMPNAKERCFRLIGHGGAHRSPEAVAYANTLHSRYYHARSAA